MINIERTIEVFGYLPDTLSKFSNKKVVHNCDDCGKERFIRKADLASGKPKYCSHCLHKGERNCNYSKHNLGSLNNNYKDGRTLIDKICPHPGCNKKISFRSNYCKNHSMCGERSPIWKGGISALHFRIRSSEPSIKWRKSVFHRDWCTCKHCGKNNIKLDAHHIKPFQKILEEFLAFYSQFSPIEDKETLLRLSSSWPEFWDVSNGISLCEECHKLEHLTTKRRDK
jgi:hypothetical protein